MDTNPTGHEQLPDSWTFGELLRWAFDAGIGLTGWRGGTEMKWTMDGFAEHLGVSEKNLKRWMNDEVLISNYKINTVFDVLSPSVKDVPKFRSTLQAAINNTKKKIRMHKKNLKSIMMEDDAPERFPLKWSDPPLQALFFGRQEELIGLIAAVLENDARPIPILGTVGIGKSALTRRMLDDSVIKKRYGPRRLYVRVEEVTDGAGIYKAILQVMQTEAGGNPAAFVCRDLGTAPAILVLDNAEVPWRADKQGTEEVLGRLAAIPKIRLVVTVRGEERPGGVRVHA